MSNNLEVSLEDRIRIYLADYPQIKNGRELASLIKDEHFDGAFDAITRKELAKLISSIKHPKPKADTSFYSVVIGCTHLPFQDEEQWDAMCILGNWLSSVHRTHLVLDGDIVDMNSISRHNRGNIAKIPSLTLSEEYERANVELNKLDWGSYVEKDYLYGNHENWYYIHMAQIDNAKLGEGVIKSPAEGLHLEERGYKIHRKYGQDFIKKGNLVISHGNYTNKHAAFAHLEAYKQDVLVFHTHRMGSFTDSGPNNTNITGYNAGFGGNRKLKPFDYMPEDMKRKWQNGFAITYTDNEGETFVDLLQWKNKKFVFMGREFSANGIKVIGE